MISKFGVISFFSFTAGIICGYFLDINQEPFFWFFISIAVIELLLLLLNKKQSAIYVLSICIFLFSFVYTDLSHEKSVSEEKISKFLDRREYLLEGYLYKPVENFDNRHRIYLKARNITDQNVKIPVTGRIRINIKAQIESASFPKNLKYGDLVSIEAKLYKASNFRNPGGIDYVNYLERQGISALGSCNSPEKIIILGKGYGISIIGSLYGMRNKILKACEKDMDPIPYQIFAAMVYGDRSSLDSGVREKFIAIGIAHVVSISGLHVGFVALLFYGIFKEILLLSGYTGRFKNTGRYCSLLTIIPVIAYSIMSGMRIPTIRAMIMLVIFLIGKACYRSRNTLKSLAVAWVFILILNPGSIADPGFQLSFLAVALILYSHHLFLSRKTQPKNTYKSAGLIFYFQTIVLVYIGTLPFVLYHFNRVSLLGILGNLILVPLFGVIISVGILNGILILANIPIYHAVTLIISRALNSIFYIMDMISNTAFCDIFFPLNTLAPVLFYYALLSSLFYLKRKKVLISSFLSVLLIISLILNFRFFRGDKLQVTYLDLGNGTSTHIALPSGEDYLVDSGSKIRIPIGRLIMDPYLHNQGLMHLNKVFISHTHSDHMSGLDHILSNYYVKELILGTSIPVTTSLRELKNLLFELEIPYTIKDYRDDEVGKLASLNNRSYVFKLKYNDVSFLFPGDADNLALYSLLRYGDKLKSTVLLLPHEGSPGSSPAEFLQKVSPEIVVISVGENNYFGHPSRDVIERLANLEPKPAIYMTKDDGAIILSTDGESINVKTWATRWK